MISFSWRDNVKTKLNSPRGRSRKRAAPPHRKASSTVPGKTIEELARKRGARPFRPAAFAGIVPPGEDIGAFVEEIYRARTWEAVIPDFVRNGSVLNNKY